MNLTNQIIFSLATLGLLFSFALLIKLNRCYFKAKLFFVGFILIQSLNIFYAYIILSGNYKSIPFIIQFNHLLQAITPTLIFFFSYFLIHPKKRFKPEFYLAFFPVLLIAGILVPFYFSDDETKIQLVETLIQNNISAKQKLIFFIKLINGIFFIILSVIELKKHEKKAFNFYSNIENKIHWWLRNALLFFLSIWGLAVFIRIGFNTTITIITLAIAVGLMDFYLVFNFMIYIISQTEEETINILSPEVQKNKIKDYSSLKNQFLEIVKLEKPFLNADCNLNCFSQKVKIKPYIISKIINQELNTTFYNFINDLRAEEASKLLLNESKQHFTIDALAEECGFKSKATFYKAYKKKYNCTPAEYKKRYS